MYAGSQCVKANRYFLMHFFWKFDLTHQTSISRLSQDICSSLSIWMASFLFCSSTIQSIFRHSATNWVFIVFSPSSHQCIFPSWMDFWMRGTLGVVQTGESERLCGDRFWQSEPPSKALVLHWQGWIYSSMLSVWIGGDLHSLSDTSRLSVLIRACLSLCAFEESCLPADLSSKSPGIILVSKEAVKWKYIFSTLVYIRHIVLHCLLDFQISSADCRSCHSIEHGLLYKQSGQWMNIFCSKASAAVAKNMAEGRSQKSTAQNVLCIDR